MDWIAHEYQQQNQEDQAKAVVTGKSLMAGGSLGRDTATADGGYFVFQALKERLGLPDSVCVVIQGFGNAGQHIAELFYKNGHKVIGLSDSKGSAFNLEGLNIEEMIKHKETTGSVMGFLNTKSISPEDFLQIECDIFIPAALEGQITQMNAKEIHAKAILELANGPVTPEADDILFARGIPCVPDILANAGGVTVSSFEWQQNLKNEIWTQEEIQEKLQKKMKTALEAVWEKQQILQSDLRRAAFVVALQRIQEAMKIERE
jgi:glutamate dehydrogenase/leucine dehydrogenase